jgi:predicted GNAT family N-acyltransferase
MEIVHRSNLTSREVDRLFRWREHVFSPLAPGIEMSALAHHYVMLDDDEAVAHAQCEVRVLERQGMRRPILGIGAVVVRPEYQGKKLGHEILAHLHGLLGSSFDAQAAWLFCAPELLRYYELAGYRRVKSPVYFEQSTGLDLCPWVSMIYEKPSGLFEDNGEIIIRSKPW